ncbi:MAG: transcription elongation factor GreA [Bacteroidetes bacterium]|nr:transcription elongation factor GreA [Bacteroidota bacterium]
MMQVSYYTESGLNKLKKELDELKTKGRADMAKQIAEARDKGDLRENAEYDAAKNAQGMLEARIAILKEKLGNARVINKSDLNTSNVSILATVKVKNKDNDQEIDYTLVSEEEADISSGKISVQSPIGKGLLGKKVGDTVKIEVPAGMMELEIVKIS